MNKRSIGWLLLLLIAASLTLSSVYGESGSAYVCGDSDGDGELTIHDVVYLLDYMFQYGPAPQPLSSGNADGCQSINMSDVISLAYSLVDSCSKPNSCESTTDCRQVVAGNQVRLGCPVTKVVVDGDSVAVPVYISNTVDLAAFSVGFQCRSADVRITSVTKGPDVPSDWQFRWKYAHENGRVLLGAADIFALGTLPALGTNYWVATLWLAVPAGTAAQCADLDTAYVAPSGEMMFTQACTHGTGTVTIVPEYVDCGEEDVIVGGTACPPLYPCGDFDLDGGVYISDVVFILEHIFWGGPAPADSSGGDVNCDGSMNIGDIVYLIRYIYSGGPAPCAGC